MAFEHIPLGQKSFKTSHARSKLRARLKRMRAGIAAELTKGQTMTFARRNVTREAMLEDIDAVLATLQSADDLARQLAILRQSERQLLPQIYDALCTLQAAMQGFFEPGNVKLASFGIKPRRPRRRLKTKEQVAAVIRRAQTRKERGTMGKKQRKALKSRR